MTIIPGPQDQISATFSPKSTQDSGEGVGEALIAAALAYHSAEVEGNVGPDPRSEIRERFSRAVREYRLAAGLDGCMAAEVTP